MQLLESCRRPISAALEPHRAHKPCSTPANRASHGLPLRSRQSAQLMSPSPLAAPAAVALAESAPPIQWQWYEQLSALHPSRVSHSNLVPVLRAALDSLRPAGAAGLSALLSSPLLLGLLSWATHLLEQPQAAALGPEAPLLVLEVLSHTVGGNSSSAAVGALPPCRLDEHCRRLWQRAHAALGDAADQAGRFALLQPDLMSPEALVRYYEACARCHLAGTPSKSSGMGLMLRHHLHNGLFTPEESVRLLSAWAALRRRRGRRSFNPDAYTYADLAANLGGAAWQLSSQQLEAVAAAAPAFQWPVYGASLPLLHIVCREAIMRSRARPQLLPAAQRVMSLAVKGATAMRPRFGHELEAATCIWLQDAHSGAAAVAAAGVVRRRSAARIAPASVALPLVPPRRHHAPLHWLPGAALATATAAYSSSIVRAAPLLPYLSATAVLALALASGDAGTAAAASASAAVADGAAATATTASLADA